MEYTNSKRIDDNTMALVAKRVAEYKKNSDQSKESTDEVNHHIDALSEVFDVDKSYIEEIAKEVIIKQNLQNSFKDDIYEKLIKYSKQVIISILMVIIISLLLIGRSSIQQPSQSIESIAIPESSSADYSQFKQKAVLFNALTSISPIKMMLLEFYSGEGVYPETLDLIGIDRQDIKTAKGIDDLILGEKGSIIIKFDKSVGNDIIMVLSPSSVMGGISIDWECKSNFKGYLQGCSKTNGAGYLEKFE